MELLRGSLTRLKDTVINNEVSSKLAFVQKVRGIQQNLPRQQKHQFSGVCECEIRKVPWEKVNEKFLRFLKEIDLSSERSRVIVSCWASPKKESASLELNFGEILSRGTTLGFSVFEVEKFYAFAELPPLTLRNPLLGELKGEEIVRLGGYKPSQKKALEFACLAADFVEDALAGKLPAKVLK